MLQCRSENGAAGRRRKSCESCLSVELWSEHLWKQNNTNTNLKTWLTSPVCQRDVCDEQEMEQHKHSWAGVKFTHIRFTRVCQLTQSPKRSTRHLCLLGEQRRCSLQKQTVWDQTCPHAVARRRAVCCHEVSDQSFTIKSLLHSAHTYHLPRHVLVSTRCFWCHHSQQTIVLIC